MAKYDLLIKNGFVVDTANNWQGQGDVGFCGGQVAAMELELNPDHAYETFDAILPSLGGPIAVFRHISPLSSQEWT